MELRGSRPVGGLATADFTGNRASPVTRARTAGRSARAASVRGDSRKPLPDLVPYRGAPETRTRARATARQARPGPTVAAIPGAAPLRRRPVDDQPFAPVGIGVGSLRLFPHVEGSVGFDSNPNRSPASQQPKSSLFWRGEAGAELRSDWSRHDLKATLRGCYNDYLNLRDASRPDATGRIDARIDVTRDTNVLLDGRFNLDTQRPSSPEITALGTRGARVEGRPIVTTTGAGIGLAQRFGALEATLRGTVDRIAYDDAKLSDGATLRLSGQSYNAVGASLRLSYEAAPGVKPFVEGFVDTRRHDESVDTAGFARNSRGRGVKAGSSFELTRVLTGEASAGWNERHYEDDRLGKLRGPIIDARLIWMATALTNLTFSASTALAETNIAGSSGAIVRRAGIDLSHALLRNLTLGAGLAYQDTAYEGVGLNEKLTTMTLRADYNLSRSVVVRGSFTHERLKSSAANADYTANVTMLGLRLQR